MTLRDLRFTPGIYLGGYADEYLDVTVTSREEYLVDDDIVTKHYLYVDAPREAGLVDRVYVGKDGQVVIEVVRSKGR